MLFSIQAIQDTNKHKTTGVYWFGGGEMAFFKSRIEPQVYPVEGGALFVTSEQCDNFDRKWSIRECCETTGDISTINDFQGYGSSDSAHEVAAEIASERNKIS